MAGYVIVTPSTLERMPFDRNVRSSFSNIARTMNMTVGNKDYESVRYSYLMHVSYFIFAISSSSCNTVCSSRKKTNLELFT
jgi:hypothetical protein